jgi:Tfp pilus assembly protein PilO
MTDQNKTALTIGLILAVLLAIVVAYWDFSTVQPRLRANVQAKQTAQQQIKDRTARLKEIDTFIADADARERLIAQVVSAQKRLPKDQQADEFLDILRIAMRDTGVAFSRIEPPRSPVQRSNYEELNFLIRGSARFHEFGQFVNIIECHPDRFMRVSGFTIGQNAKRPSIHPVDLNVSTFLFRERVAAPAETDAPSRTPVRR